MTALAVALTHRARFLHLFADEHVDQAGLPHARLPHQHRGGAGGHEGAHGLHAFGVAVRHHQRAHVGARQRTDALGHLLHLRLALGQVGLREHHRDGGAGLVGQHQLALQAAQVHLGQRLGQDDAVEVRRQHLGDGALGGVLAHERALARADGLDDALVVALGRVHLDEIADDGAHLLPFDQGRCVFAAHKAPVLASHERIPAVQFHNLRSLQALLLVALSLAFAQQIEHHHHGQADHDGDHARDERVDVELVGGGLALLRDRHHLRVQVGCAVVVGAR